jgi:phage terminase large subunit-like protein
MMAAQFLQPKQVDPVQEYLDLIAEKERRDSFRRWENYIPYPKQAEWLSWIVPIKVMFGGNRCLGGETEIFDPVSGVTRRVDSITDDFHVWSWDGEKRVIAKAHKPFKKAPQDIYRFVFEDGTEITASPGHLFLGKNGWTSAGSLISECQGESSVCLLPSSLDTDQLALLEDALHSIEIALDSQSGCPVCSRSCDERLRMGVGDGLDLISVPFSTSLSRIENTVCLPVWDLCQDVRISDHMSTGIRRALSACVVSSKLKIVSIERLRHDEVWDFTVEVYGNYFIGNVLSHNTGKTYSAGFEMTCHLTGQYPDWWKGKRFYSPIKAWCVAVTYKQLREVMQLELLGDINQSLGTGMIPKELIVDHSMALGVSDVVDQIWVRHASGGVSVLGCMVNQSGREAFQGPSKDVIWLDEECDHDVFTECRLRTMTVKGIILVTFTPLKGLTSLAKWLLNEEDSSVVRRIIIGWDDVPHLSEEDKRQMCVGLLPHEIEARRSGLPTMASGLIYPFMAKDILVRPFEIDSHWPGITGLDVATAGITAGAWLRYDRSSKTTYLVDCHRQQRQPTSVHASAIKRKFGNYPIRIDPSANRTERDGENIIKEYREEFGDDWEIKNAKNAVYFGINRLYNAMSEGRFKVFSNQRDWISEWQEYIWDPDKTTSEGEPKPRKINDHLMDATRYGYIDLNEARPLKQGSIIRPTNKWEPLDPITGY